VAWIFASGRRCGGGSRAVVAGQPELRKIFDRKRAPTGHQYPPMIPRLELILLVLWISVATSLAMEIHGWNI
jgi:hypothetical protein